MLIKTLRLRPWQATDDISVLQGIQEVCCHLGRWLSQTDIMQPCNRPATGWWHRCSSVDDACRWNAAEQAQRSRFRRFREVQWRRRASISECQWQQVRRISSWSCRQEWRLRHSALKTIQWIQNSCCWMRLSTEWQWHFVLSSQRPFNFVLAWDTNVRMCSGFARFLKKINKNSVMKNQTYHSR